MNFTHTHVGITGVSRVNLSAYLLDSISFTPRDPDFPHEDRQKLKLAHIPTVQLG